MSIKLQIGSLEALERLIGGDSEVEVELRTAIVQDFAKRHLKGIITKEVLDKIVVDFRGTFKSYLLDQFCSVHRSWNDVIKEFIFKDPYKTAVIKHLHDLANEVVTTYKDELTEHIKHQITLSITEMHEALKTYALDDIKKSTSTMVDNLIAELKSKWTDAVHAEAIKLIDNVVKAKST